MILMIWSYDSSSAVDCLKNFAFFSSFALWNGNLP